MKAPEPFNKTVKLSTLLLSVTISACGVGERQISVENCGEPIQVSDCDWQGQLFSCLVTNTGNTQYKGSLVWRYDAAGQPLETAPYQYAVGLQPGNETRIKLPVTKFNKDATSKIIFCSKKPVSNDANAE